MTGNMDSGCELHLAKWSKNKLIILKNSIQNVIPQAWWGHSLLLLPSTHIPNSFIIKDTILDSTLSSLGLWEVAARVNHGPTDPRGPLLTPKQGNPSLPLTRGDIEVSPLPLTSTLLIIPFGHFHISFLILSYQLPRAASKTTSHSRNRTLQSPGTFDFPWHILTHGFIWSQSVLPLYRLGIQTQRSSKT